MSYARQIRRIMIIKSFDGKEITIYEWLDCKEPKGIVQIAHGMVDHATRFDRFAKYLNQKGYLVIASDHRGHGETDKETLGYSEGDMFNDTVRDLAFIAKQYGEKYQGLKYILFGFSYGSFLAQSFIGRYSRFIDGVVLGGSAYMNKVSTTFATAVAFIGKKYRGANAPAKLIKKMTFEAYDKSFKEGVFLSTNEENNENYYKDELTSFICSYNFYESFFKGLNSLYTKVYADGVVKTMPIMIISGADDAVGGKSRLTTKLYNYYKKINCINVSLNLIQGSRHEFLNEDDWITSAGLIKNFCDKCDKKNRK